MEQTAVEAKEKLLTKKDVVKAFWRWTFFSHANYNYERLQATGVVHAFSPILKKLYGKDEDEMKSALERHMQFFNTEPWRSDFSHDVCDGRRTSIGSRH